MAGRKNTNKEKIEKAKKELETLSAILGEILCAAPREVPPVRWARPQRPLARPHTGRPPSAPVS